MVLGISLTVVRNCQISSPTLTEQFQQLLLAHMWVMYMVLHWLSSYIVHDEAHMYGKQSGLGNIQQHNYIYPKE